MYWVGLVGEASESGDSGEVVRVVSLVADRWVVDTVNRSEEEERGASTKVLKLSCWRRNNTAITHPKQRKATCCLVLDNSAPDVKARHHLLLAS